MNLKQTLNEPLLHFLLLGAVVFIAYSLMSKGSSSGEPGKIVITQGQVEHLATGFSKIWQRPPTPEELEGLVRDLVREEIYCREAMAMGLDKNDTVIRRRLRQKLEFVSDDIAAQIQPTEDELNAYLKTHFDLFRMEPRFTFRHVYFNPEKHGATLANDAAHVLAMLKQAGAKAAISGMGDAFLLEHQFDSIPVSEVAKQFGVKFAARLGKLQPGQWQGPVESGYGLHLVLVSERKEGHLPELTDVRDAVRREWEDARRLEANEKFYQELRKRYTVTIESLEPSVENKKLVAGETR